MRKILVIDDEKPTLFMFRLFLTTYGYEALTAENGEEGVEVFARESPAIVLTDIKMPGMDGIEVLRRIKKIQPATQVIVITGHGDMDLALQALNMDATDFVNKPVSKADLDGALKRAEERLRLALDNGRDIEASLEGDIGVIAIRGSVTSLTEASLYEAYDRLAQDGARRFVLDFSENASVNGAGIAILFQLLDKGGHDGREIVMSGISSNFRQVFASVGLSGRATVFDTLPKALKGLAAS